MRDGSRRTKVGQALSYAGIGPDEDPADERERTRTEITTRWLPRIVDEVLVSDEIARGMAQAGMDPQDVRRRVLDNRAEVLAAADAELMDAVDAVLRAPAGTELGPLETKPDRMLGVVMMLVGIVIVGGPATTLGLFWSALPAWLIVLLAVPVIAAVVFGLIIMAAAVDTYSGEPTTARARLAAWAQVCREDGVLPFVRRVVDERLAPFARFVLGVTTEDAPGLRGTSESSYVVRTSSVEAFLTATERLPTGAIGLAGPRGVGKTSMIDYFADHGARATRVTVSAPVRYEARDFVLHLFASVCQVVVRERSAGRRLRRDPVVAAARRHLENIHYLRSHTSGWSGKFTLPLRSEAGWSRQTQRERRPQTYPELVDALREFLGTYARAEGGHPAMIVAIDELDKIESADRAQQFLNEIKGIFGAAGTQFLVAVSEDALASFERRGLPVRDAFDSAFHEIVRVDYLTLSDTATLLSSRVLRLAEPFKWLVHCLSGGLPRDVVRTARAMVALTGGLDEVCEALVADDLRRKSHAFQLACRDIGDSPDVTEFIRSLRRLPGDAPHLLGLVPVLRQDGDLATLSRQAAAYVY